MKDLALVAINPKEMTQCQAKLVGWAEQMIGAERAEMAAHRKNQGIAEENKWASSPWKRLVSLSEKKIVFFEKLIAALRAGYYIVPNFPVDVFAIRTDREKPIPAFNSSTHGTPDIPDESAKALPSGEGDYKSPAQEVTTWQEHEKNGKGEEVTRYYVEAFDYADIEMPFVLARPEVLTETQRAMALKIFDEIAVCPQNGKRGDPMILGRIINPTKSQWSSKRHITFMIAWFTNTRDLV